MKNFTFLLFFLALGAVGCFDKEGDDDVRPHHSVKATPPANVDFQALVVGTWQLTATATEDHSMSGGCSGNQSNIKTTWTPVTNGEVLSFATNGNFGKFENGAMSCKGSYRIKSGYLSTAATCMPSNSQMFSAMNANSMTIERNDGSNGSMQFSKMSDTPQQ